MLEKIIETKTCTSCTNNFDITNIDKKFYNKFEVPNPDLCPTCREQSRLLWRNERKLYKRTCDATGKQIISVYSPNKPYKVYNREFWWSDKWNSLDYWIKYDFEKTAFKQFENLFREVPMQDLIWSNNENSPYCHLVAENKNCYLITESSNNEDCFYGYWLQKCKDCIDCSYMHKCIKCYESDNCINCFNSNYLFNCTDCSDSSYLTDCIWCSYCFLCTNLINKKYFIYNEEYSEKEYFEKVKEIKKEEDNIFNKFLDFSKKSIKKSSKITNSVNSIWNQITSSKNCINCFQAHDAEDCRYSENVFRWAKNCMDANTAGIIAEKIYYSLNCWINVYNIKFSNQCWESSDILYCSNCNSCKNCFLSVWLVNKEYCVLNIQYTKEEYEKLVSKIIKQMINNWEWWEFLPAHISPFWYNETVANEYYPLTKQKALEKWFNWSDYEQPNPKAKKIIPANKLPENISDIPDDILNWAIKCEETEKPFKMIKQELKFYRKQNIKIPTKHQDIRHRNRVALWNPRKLFKSKCDKCNNDILTIYNDNRDETVYCEECYNKKFY